MNESLLQESYSTISKCDLVIFLFDATKDLSSMDHILNSFKHYNTLENRKNKIKIMAVLNKMDLFSKQDIFIKLDDLSKLNLFRDIFPISAKTGYGIKSLREHLSATANESNWKYEKDVKTNLNEKERALEIVREKFYRRLNKEIPYDLDFKLTQWKEIRDGQTFIEYEVKGKTKGQYAILISSLKYIHERAKVDLEKTLEKKISLTFKILK
jgi:GTPase